MSRYPFPIPDLAGRVMTVTGPIDPADLGVTLMHEHLFVDLRRPARFHRPGEDSPAAHEPLSQSNLAHVRHGFPNADNDRLDDYDDMLNETRAFTDAGGRTIVDVTPIGVGREPELLARLSRETGMPIVMGGAFYTPTFHPADMDDRTVDDLADEIVRDIAVGVGATGIRSGIIGEVGSDSHPLTDNELKSIRAAGRASSVTGAPITFHVGGVNGEKILMLDIVAEEGVVPENVVIGHGGELLHNPEFAEKVFARGVFVELDFLASPGSPWGHLILGSDHRVAAGIAELVAAGYERQLLLGHDVCQKIQLKKYGGQGFDYISKHFLPALARLGVSDTALHAIMVENPARALTFAAPRT